MCAGSARADADAGGRAAGASGAYLHTAGLDGGVAAAWWQEPLGGALTIDGAIGVVIATTAGTTAATLTNPHARARYRVAPTTWLDLTLTLPAASRHGDGGAVAAAVAAADRIDPAPWLAGATTLAAGGARAWTNGLGELTVAAGVALTLRGDAPALPLLHVDLAGAVALTDTVGLTAAFATTSYALVDPRDETFVHALALGGRYRDCRITVDVALEVPVDARDRAVDTLMATAAVAWRL